MNKLNMNFSFLIPIPLKKNVKNIKTFIFKKIKKHHDLLASAEQVLFGNKKQMVIYLELFLAQNMYKLWR